MHDIFNNLQDEISRYVEDFHSLNHRTIGFVGVAGNRILGCDIFANPEVYHKFENKLIRSYALDAIEYQKKIGDMTDVEQFLSAVLTTSSKKKNCTSKNIKIKGDRFLGQVLTVNNQPIHLSAFPV